MCVWRQFNQYLKKSEGSTAKIPKVELTISIDGVAIQDPKTRVSPPSTLYRMSSFNNPQTHSTSPNHDGCQISIDELYSASPDTINKFYRLDISLTRSQEISVLYCWGDWKLLLYCDNFSPLNHIKSVELVDDVCWE
ncbi:GULP1 [Cordylochernes scorpioides]|uniref:GULP1 n=1 Tax=Cordylochernes scorpioides TaxID=51811 RepID=A0ABY6JWQ6_9ARAC|nr:GULP1 [Cordylochernes scorpioides]